MKQLFPKEFLDNTIEVHQFKHRSSSKIIYAIILLSIVTAFIALPFISVDIYTSARGLIKPDKERISVTTIISGKVLFTHLKNNKLVHKGDTLLVLDNFLINEKLQLSNKQIKDFDLLIKDLNYLTHTKTIKIEHLKSPKYKKEYLLYNQKQRALQTKKKKLKIDYDRNKLLYKKEVIAKIEFENSKFEYDLVLNGIYQLKQQQVNTWQATLTDYKSSLIEIHSSKKQLQNKTSEFIVTAPISGTLLNIKSLESGSFINAGAVLATISPNTNLLVECFISPSDIGLLNTNTRASFQIDAYNYNQWGLASGKISEISKDIEFIDNISGFKVICSINEKQLQLKNGFEGKLKKGMTLNAQFKLAERTLFDLLYDKIDDWINPSQKTIATTN